MQLYIEEDINWKNSRNILSFTFMSVLTVNYSAGQCHVRGGQ